MRPASSRPESERPWYRHGLVWLVIGLPAASVIAGLTTLAIAITHADDTVVDHWYKDGKAINRSLEEEQRADRLGLRLAIDPDKGVILRSDIALPWPAQLEVALRHPVFAERDRLLTLTHRGGGDYGPAARFPQEGNWTVTVTPPDGHWRLRQRLALSHERVTVGASP